MRCGRFSFIFNGKTPFHKDVRKHGYAPSKTQPLNFEGTFRIEAIDAERCRGDGTRQAEYIDLLPEAHIKARGGILHERGEKSARQICSIDRERSRVARRLPDAVVAENTVTDAANASRNAIAARRVGIGSRRSKGDTPRTEYGRIFTVRKAVRTSRKGGQSLALHDALRRGGQREVAVRDRARPLRGARETIVPRIRTTEGDPRVVNAIRRSDVLVVVSRACGGCRDIVTRDGTRECRTELRCVCGGCTVVGLCLLRDCAKGQLLRRNRAFARERILIERVVARTCTRKRPTTPPTCESVCPVLCSTSPVCTAF